MNNLNCIIGSILLFLVNYNIAVAEGYEYHTIRDYFIKAHAQVFSVKGRYKYEVVNGDGGSSSSLNIYAEYVRSNNIIYYEKYDEGFDNLKVKFIYHDGITKILHFNKDTDGLIRPYGLIDESGGVEFVKFQPFGDIYDRLLFLLDICDSGGMNFSATSVVYNEKDCILIELTGSGNIPDINGIDPDSIKQYYAPESKYKIWIGKKYYYPIRYEYYGVGGKFYFSQSISYQEIEGYDVHDIYAIPSKIISEYYNPDGELNSKTIASFIGEWEVNRIYSPNSINLEFPKGLRVRDLRTGTKYIVE